MPVAEVREKRDTMKINKHCQLIILQHMEIKHAARKPIATRVVTCTYLKTISNILKATLERLAAPHDVLDIVDTREPECQEVKELGLC